ncbi:SWIM zinc finger family protein, partial [Streptomyces bambusae]
MTEQGVRWTAEQVLALAPDDASRKAGGRLGGAGPWSQTGGSASGSVWGLCKGSGSKPYRTVVDLTGPAYKCSCPSRKFPCKHALGLLLLWAAEGHVSYTHL